MVKLNKELTLGVLLVVIVIMVLKPNLLGFLYNNVLGKLIFVAAVVFLSLKHTAAGLLAVVFVAIVASMSGYHGFEGMEVPSDEKKEEEEEKKKCEGEDCDAETKEGAETQKKPEAVKDIEALLKVK
jgi:membrane protein implicated in regulation of membrane protease activity